MLLNQWDLEDQVFSIVGKVLPILHQKSVVKGSLLDFKILAEKIVIHDLSHIFVLLKVKR